MKSKRMRLGAMLMAVLLLVGTLAACGSGETTNSSEEASPESQQSAVEQSGAEDGEISYPLEGSPKLTVVASENAYVLNSCPTWQETPFVQKWAEETGVDLEASFVSDFSVYLASGEYADIIIYSWSSYNGGAAKAISDGIIVPIEEYVEELAPDYWATLNEDPNYLKSAVTSSGNLIGFCNIRTEPTRNSWGAYLRGDWLEELQLEVPETLDEFTEVLREFQQKQNADIPLGITLDDLKKMGRCGILTSPFGLVNTEYYQENGTIHYGAYEDAYRDYVIYLNQLYEEGLLDSNILTVDGTMTKSNLMNEVSGVTVGYASGGMGATMQQMAETDPEFDLVAMGSLLSDQGGQAMYSQKDGYLSATAAAITTSCEDVETAVKFLNYGYTEQGNLLMDYGIEGESYELIDDYPHYTDFVKNNPDGLTFAQAISLYGYTPANGPYVSHDDYMTQTYTENQIEALSLWRDNDTEKYFVPQSAISVAEENMSDYSSIKSEVDTCVNEYFSKFVTGEYSVDEKWDEYISTLEGMGIETMLQYYQEAYDEYQSR